MPLYEFHCSECGHDFDEMKRISQRDEPEPCPECGQPAERQISAAALGGTGSGGSMGFSGASAGGGCTTSG